MGAAKKQEGGVLKFFNVFRDRERDHEKAMIQSIQRAQVVVEYTVDGSVISFNGNGLKLAGYELSEVEGQNHRIFCEPSYAASVEYKEFWEQLRRGEFQSGEFKRIGKNGKEIWVVASYSPVFDHDGRVVKVIVIATDITESKVELNVRTEIMNLTSIVSESNLRGDITQINDKFTEISKYSREELIGKPHNTTRHPDMPKEVFKDMWATIGRGKMFRGVVKNRAKDGTPYYVDAVIAPIIGDNGKPKKYIGVRYDITQLEIERQNMRGVLRAIDNSLAYIEFDTGGHVLSCNKIFQDILGYSQDEIRGRHHEVLCESSYAKSADYENFWKNLREGKNRSGIFKRITRSGKTVWLQKSYAPVMDEVGRVVKVIGVATNVTELQNMIVSVQETANTLSTASSELTATASEMSQTARKTSDESESAAAAAEQVSVGVQTVAANIEEMVASIKEIGRSTNESARMAKTTMAKAQESNEIVTKLGTSSQEIGDVIKVISSIAQQTNLLALNATIEAARAGEAGKGFAVVANEVKELAKQTAQATDDITMKIGAIQSETNGAVSAIAGIFQAVEKLNGLSSVIAAAVEEQTATTNEISRVVVESKKGVESIASTAKSVSTAASESHASADHTLSASKKLMELADSLSALVKRG